jgi:hypothetical protein
MGAHIIDLLSPEIAGTGTFEYTFIYGKYDGKLNFLEPMVTKDFLDTQESIDVDIRKPEKWMDSGFYPVQYQIHYKSEQDLYSISMMNLQKFE